MTVYILYNLLMSKKKAKLIYKHNYFEIVEDGDFVLCAITGKEILLKNLNYWNVDLQEAYYSAVEVNKRFQSIKK
tara:strand:+ start:282 stop:506 length:225 start_codon:yes stop_codon:yes gene_type:complete